MDPGAQLFDWSPRCYMILLGYRLHFEFLGLQVVFFASVLVCVPLEMDPKTKIQDPLCVLLVRTASGRIETVKWDQKAARKG